MPTIIAKKGSDEIKVEILDDGSLKISTGKISMANHGGAELLIRELIKGAGGEAVRAKAGHAHSHDHHGEHVHE